MFEQTNYFLRTVVVGGVVGLLGFAGWEGREWLHREQAVLEAKDEAIVDLSRKLEVSQDAHQKALAEKRAELAFQKEEHQRNIDALAAEHRAAVKLLEDDLARVNTALKFLKLEHRVARLEVLKQEPDPADAEQVLTTVRFSELNDQGQPLGMPIVGTVQGKELYIDAPIIQFKDEFVEQGDVLRGKSICRFRRLFGDQQSPREGLSLDRPPESPGDMTEFEKSLWDSFWKLANDPRHADQSGVRTAQGGGPSIIAEVGAVYRIDLRANGGLEIKAETPKTP